MTASPGHIRTLSLAEEQVARLVAAQELPANAIAKRAKLARSTLYLWLADPAMQARIAALREEFRAQAMADEPFADKRARVVTLGALARHVLTTLRETNLEETYYYGPDALEAKRFDAPRMETFRKFLRDIAEEMGDRGGAQAGTTVGVVVKVYTDPRLERPLEADWDDAPPPRNRPDQ